MEQISRLIFDHFMLGLGSHTGGRTRSSMHKVTISPPSTMLIEAAP